MRGHKTFFKSTMTHRLHALCRRFNRRAPHFRSPTDAVHIMHLGLAGSTSALATAEGLGETRRAAAAAAIDALHAHYMPISNRFDCHGNRAAAAFSRPARPNDNQTGVELADRREKGRIRSVHSILIRFALSAPSDI